MARPCSVRAMLGAVQQAAWEAWGQVSVCAVRHWPLVTVRGGAVERCPRAHALLKVSRAPWHASGRPQVSGMSFGVQQRMGLPVPMQAILMTAGEGYDERERKQCYKVSRCSPSQHKKTLPALVPWTVHSAAWSPALLCTTQAAMHIAKTLV